MRIETVEEPEKLVELLKNETSIILSTTYNELDSMVIDEIEELKSNVSNRIMKDFCDSHRRMFYIDIVGESLLSDGTPDPVLFRADALHPSK